MRQVPIILPIIIDENPDPNLEKLGVPSQTREMVTNVFLYTVDNFFPDIVKEGEPPQTIVYSGGTSFVVPLHAKEVFKLVNEPDEATYMEYLMELILDDMGIEVPMPDDMEDEDGDDEGEIMGFDFYLN